MVKLQETMKLCIVKVSCRAHAQCALSFAPLPRGDTTRGPRSQDLTEVDITNRIMRKDNFMVALVNR